MQKGTDTDIIHNHWFGKTDMKRMNESKQNLQEEHSRLDMCVCKETSTITNKIILFKAARQ